MNSGVVWIRGHPAARAVAYQLPHDTAGLLVCQFPLSDHLAVFNDEHHARLNTPQARVVGDFNVDVKALHGFNSSNLSIVPLGTI